MAAGTGVVWCPAASALLYWYLCRDLDRVAEQAAIAAADAGLDSGTAAG
jgi:hypothetical protein